MKYEIPVLTQAAQVQRVIEKNPGCKAALIAEELGMTINAVNTQTQRLRERGLVKRVKVPGIRAIHWWPGREEGYQPRREKEAPKQTVVSEWQPCTLRDPLVDALFGRQA